MDKRLVIKAFVDLEASPYGKLQAFSFKGLKDGSVVDHSVEYSPLGLTGWVACALWIDVLRFCFGTGAFRRCMGDDGGA